MGVESWSESTFVTVLDGSMSERLRSSWHASHEDELVAAQSVFRSE